MFNFQDIDFKKEIERIKKEDPGNIRGSLIISIHDYIVLSKGEEGWKMVKYEITEGFNSASGKVFPSKTTVSVIQFLPEDLQWVVLGSN